MCELLQQDLTFCPANVTPTKVTTASSSQCAAWMTATFEATTMSSRGLFWSLPEKMPKMLWEQREDNPLLFFAWSGINQNFGLGTEHWDTQKQMPLLLNSSLVEVRTDVLNSRTPNHPNAPWKEVIGIQYLCGYTHMVFVGKIYSSKHFFFHCRTNPFPP